MFEKLPPLPTFVVQDTHLEKTPQDGSFLKATINRVTFHNEQTGFAVLRVEPESVVSGSNFADKVEVTVVGEMPAGIRPGASIVARGRWREHPKFGSQFQARSITETRPTSQSALLRYLSSGAIKGIGSKLAERILEAFGEQTLEVLDNDIERLLEVSGLGEKKFEEIQSAWNQKQNLREVMLFFQEHNVSLSLAQRIFNHYGDRSIEVAKKNPYVLARDIRGIGFITADRIGHALGVDPRSPARILAGQIHVLQKAADDGHCFLPRDHLFSKVASLLQLEDYALFVEALEAGKQEGHVIEESAGVYLPALLAAEQRLVESLAARVIQAEEGLRQIPQDLVQRHSEQQVSISSAADAAGVQTKVIRLSEEQKRAVSLVGRHSLVVITGGPGCGKTTLVRSISSLFKAAGLNVKLAAPTGRAAQRLAEVCGMEASTIHRLLKFDPSKRSFLHDAKDPLALDALIVDESSMIDISLASSLFQAIPDHARVVVVGDADQLPSVGPGLFLGDLLSIPQIVQVRLTNLFRRELESSITQIAHQVNAGKIPLIPQPDGMTQSDSYFLPVETPSAGAELVERLVVDQLPKKFGFGADEVTVLTPMNQGDLGIISLNRRLQECLVPIRPGLPRVKVGNIEFRLGDRVCQRVNNYNITQGGVFNGDQGKVIGIDVEKEGIIVQLWDGRELEYPSDALYQLDLAYALTIHRSQGSEVPAVILVLHDSHTILLERQLIYTGITRAKKLLIVVGTSTALGRGVKRARSKRRFTALVDRVQQELAPVWKLEE